MASFVGWPAATTNRLTSNEGGLNFGMTLLLTPTPSVGIPSMLVSACSFPLVSCTTATAYSPGERFSKLQFATPPTAGTRTVEAACFFDSSGKPVFEENSAQPTIPEALETPVTVTSMRPGPAADAPDAASSSSEARVGARVGRRREASDRIGRSVGRAAGWVTSE